VSSRWELAGGAARLPSRSVTFAGDVDLEVRIAGRLAARDLDGAATEAIEGYGPELFGFLVALLRSEADAGEVFAQTCEDLWVGLERFEGRSSMRTWLYTLARHAAARWRRAPHRRPGLHVTPSALSHLAERVRTATQRHLQTAAMDRLRAIRESLDDEERAILVLRVDRAMSWAEIARIFSPDVDDDAALARESARLRKRFQAVKIKIRAAARRAGLLADDADAGADDPAAATRPDESDTGSHRA
jgi:RNA polymerase sigma-70 factor, ECF subfamily